MRESGRVREKHSFHRPIIYLPILPSLHLGIVSLLLPSSLISVNRLRSILPPNRPILLGMYFFFSFIDFFFLLLFADTGGGRELAERDLGICSQK